MIYYMKVFLTCMKLLASCRAQVWIENRMELWHDIDQPGKAVDRASRYALFISGPDHLQMAQYDSDVADVRDVMVEAVALTGDGRYRYAGYDTAGPDNAWMFGGAGVAGYSVMVGRKPENLSLVVADARYVFPRNSWGEDSYFTYMRYGPLGGGHGHTNLTHISLHYRDCPVLVNSDRYSYAGEEPLRPFLKSAQIHNVRIIDGESHGKPRGLWGYGGFGQSFKNYYRGQGPVHYREMAYYGYLMSSAHYLVIRKVMAVDQGIWTIVNDMHCDDGHKVKKYYHLGSVAQGISMETGTDGAGGCWRLCSGKYDAMTVLDSRPFKVVPCVISEQYSQREKSARLVRKTGFTDRITDWICLFGEGTEAEKAQVFQYGSSRPETEGRVTAMSLCLSPDGSWNFLMWNRETWQGGKIHDCRGAPVYAKAMVIHTINEDTTLY